jgi:hypothetical protein
MAFLASIIKNRNIIKKHRSLQEYLARSLCGSNQSERAEFWCHIIRRHKENDPAIPRTRYQFHHVMFLFKSWVNLSIASLINGRFDRYYTHIIFICISEFNYLQINPFAANTRRKVIPEVMFWKQCFIKIKSLYKNYTI